MPDTFKLTLSLPSAAGYALERAAKRCGLSVETFAEELLRNGFIRYLEGLRMAQTLGDLFNVDTIVVITETDAPDDESEDSGEDDAA